MPRLLILERFVEKLAEELKNHHNQHMKGVDQVDQYVGFYSIHLC